MPMRLRGGAAVVAVVLGSQALVILPTAFFSPAVARAAEVAFTPSDPNASAATASELEYLGNLPSVGKFVTGSFAGYSSSDGTLTGFQDVADVFHATGQYPGLVECDYNGGFSKGGDPTDVITSSCDGYLEGYWSQGGLVEVGWHPNNPVGGAYDTPLTAGQISDLTNSSTTTYANWHDQLAQVAAAINQVGAAGVVVIFRPLMEMNGGGFFWWNGGGWTGPAFVAVWRDMYNYITSRLTYHNVLWDWSPDQAGANPTASGNSYYPGGGYVDITGLDVYATNDTNANYPTASITNYGNVLESGKPFAFNEIGTQKTTTFDFSAWPNAIKASYSKASFFLAWNDVYGPLGTYSTGARALMNDPSDINLSATHLLAGFEGGSPDGWGGWTSQSGALAGPWSISSANGSDWASQGQYALKGNITNLGQGQQAILNDYGADLDLAGKTALTATVNVAPWNSPADGMTAALYIRTGSANAWYSAPSEPVSYSAAGTTLTLNLADIPNLGDVNELGVDFVPANGSSSGSIYVDNVIIQGPLLAAGFEGGSPDGWGGWTSQSGALAGPWSISSANGSDWASQGQYALKGNITNLGQGQQAILNDYGTDVDFTGQAELSATVNIASWTSPATGMTAALYIRTGPASAWFSGSSVPISYSPAGTTLTLNLANIPNLNQVNEIGVDFVPSTGATTGSVYVDTVFVQ